MHHARAPRRPQSGSSWLVSQLLRCTALGWGLLLLYLVTTAVFLNLLSMRSQQYRDNMQVMHTRLAAADRQIQDLRDAVAAATAALPQAQGTLQQQPPPTAPRQLPPAAVSPPEVPPPSAPAPAPAPAPGGDAAAVWGDDAPQQPRQPPEPASAASPPQQPPPSLSADTVPPAAGGGKPTSLLVICYNRPEYLRRTMAAVMKYLPASNPPAVYISQDGSHRPVTAVIEGVKEQLGSQRPDVAFTHLRHKQEVRSGDDRQGYSKLARHFGWALQQLLVAFDHPRVIVLEDDLEIAPDFFTYFDAVAPLLDRDPTLLGATAWNDLGQPKFSSDPHALYRSDFFGGLGWMLSRAAWDELGPKWPTGYWDDWLREPPQRKDRAFIRPEVSRTFTFGQKGVSASQFYSQYLATIHLNDQPSSWSTDDIAALVKDTYDPKFLDTVRRAVTKPIADVKTKHCQPGHSQDYRVVYHGFGRTRGGYEAVATSFGFIPDVKAKVPRTAYKGVVTIRWQGCRVFITPQNL